MIACCFHYCTLWVHWYKGNVGCLLPEFMCKLLDEDVTTVEQAYN